MGRSPFTRDYLYNGRVVLFQPRNGYRFSLDAPLLTYFSHGGKGGDKKVKRALDLGSGCGVVAIGLLASAAARRVDAVEVQSELVHLTRKNAEENDFEGALRVFEDDVRSARRTLQPGNYDLITCNPPFWPIAEARRCGCSQRDIACREVLGDLDDWTGTASSLVHERRGRVCFVYPARRFDALICSLAKHRMAVTRARFVHPRADKAAESFLVEARRGSTSRAEVEPPLVLSDDRGEATSDADAVFSGRFAASLEALPDLRNIP